MTSTKSGQDIRKLKLRYSTPAKVVKKLIAERMNDRKKRISVALGECDFQFDRILIHYPKNLEDGTLLLNSITEILKKTNFYIVQIVDWWQKGKNTILICRGYKKECTNCHGRGHSHFDKNKPCPKCNGVGYL